MQNPLDSNEMFEFDGMNPNPSFSKTKDGPVYRISFEVTQETWQDFVAANTSGMIVTAMMQVTESYSEPKKGGQMSREAAKICKEPHFQAFASRYYKHKYDQEAPVTEEIAVSMIY